MVGHGGTGADAEFPMNSREALLGGLESGFAGIEMDVQLTADGVLVAYHDGMLSDKPPCNGLINSSTWAVLRNCAMNGTKLVRVDSLLLEALERFPEAEFTLDVKLFAAGGWWPYLEAFSDSIASMSRMPQLRKPLLVECQVEDFVVLVHRKAPAAQCYYYAKEAQVSIPKAKELDLAGITIAHDLIDAEEVAKAHAEGLSVTLFGVSGNWALGRAVRKGPDRIQSDVALGP